MTTTFRIALLVISLLTAWYTFRKIRKSQMLISDAIFWMLLSAGFVALSIFPQIAVFGAQTLGVISPVNFIFLVVVFLLIVKMFLLSVDLSVLKMKLTSLVEEYAVRAHKWGQPANGPEGGTGLESESEQREG